MLWGLDPNETGDMIILSWEPDYLVIGAGNPGKRLLWEVDGNGFTGNGKGDGKGTVLTKV